MINRLYKRSISLIEVLIVIGIFIPIICGTIGYTIRSYKVNDRKTLRGSAEKLSDYISFTSEISAYYNVDIEVSCSLENEVLVCNADVHKIIPIKVRDSLTRKMPLKHIDLIESDSDMNKCFQLFFSGVLGTKNFSNIRLYSKKYVCSILYPHNPGSNYDIFIEDRNEK